MATLRALQGFAKYRSITNAVVEDVAEADWLADLRTELGVSTDLETAIEIYDQDEVVVSCFFLNSGDTVVLEPHFYDASDVLLCVGAKVTYTPSASSSTLKTIAASPAITFGAPFEFLANPGANYLRIKATTLPTTASVGVFIGHRA